MTIKVSIHITLLWLALLVASPSSSLMLCDMTDQQEEVPLCAGNGPEARASGHDDCRDDGCRDDNCCDDGCLDCGLACCTGLSYIMTSLVRPSNINGINGPIHPLGQCSFWVGLDPFYHPPQV